MEVCGGHTHAIYRFGLEGRPARQHRADPRPRLPGLRAADGPDRRRARAGRAAGGDLRGVRRHDAGAGHARAARCEHKARGIDVRIVYSPLDALKLARANPDRHVMFFAIGFETTAPSTALTLMRAKARAASRTSRSSATTSPSSRRSARSSTRPTCGSTASSAPATSRPSSAAAPTSGSRSDEGKPIVVSGFEPLDMLQAHRDAAAPARATGRAEVENQYERRGAVGGQPRRARARWRRCSSCGPTSSGAGSASSRSRRCGSATRTPRWDAERRSTMPGVRVTDPKAAQCGEVLKGVLKPHQCKLFGKECTPEHPVGALMVSSEGSAPPTTTTSIGRRAAASALADRWHDRRRRRPHERPRATIRFRDPQIEMAHGAGGKASRRLVEGLFAPLLRRPRAWRRSAMPPALDVDGAPARVHHRQLRRPPAAVPRRIDRRAGGERHGERPRGVRRQAAWRWSSRFVLEAGLPTPVLEAEVRAMADAAARGGRRDRRRRHQGGRARQGGRHVHHHRRHRPRRCRGVRCRRVGVRPGDRVLLSGPIGDHGITILLARGELDLEADLRSDTRSVLPLVEALVDAAAPALRWMRDPTRGGVATSLNELARDCGLGVIAVRGAHPGARRGARRLRAAGPRSAAHRQRGPVPRGGRAGARRRGARRRCARRPAASEAASIGEVREEPAGAVLATTRYGGTPDRRHAGGRSAAADLLRRSC